MKIEKDMKDKIVRNILIRQTLNSPFHSQSKNSIQSRYCGQSFSKSNDISFKSII